MKKLTGKIKLIIAFLVISITAFGYLNVKKNIELTNHNSNLTEKAEQTIKIKTNNSQNKWIEEFLKNKIEKQKSFKYKKANVKYRNLKKPEKKISRPNIPLKQNKYYKRKAKYDDLFIDYDFEKLISKYTDTYPTKIWNSQKNDNYYPKSNNYNSTSNNSSNYSSKSNNSSANSWGYTNPSHEYVKGYTKKNGTQVEGYFRTKRNSSKSDNFSSKGNRNPYTGKKGYK